MNPVSFPPSLASKSPREPQKGKHRHGDTDPQTKQSCLETESPSSAFPFYSWTLRGPKEAQCR